MVRAICAEMEMQQHYLAGETVKTVYFGGGTPSILDVHHLDLLLSKTYKTFRIDSQAEITLEANPDDLNLTKLMDFKKLNINRLSIGIQSFNEAHLKYLNRAHNAMEALQTYKEARKAGFDNISIDLIYGIPYHDHSVWEHDLKTATALNPEHISSYCLTIEEKTAFGSWLKKGKIRQVDEEFAATQFEMLVTTLENNRYIQYEISNFCLPRFESKHNSNYWKQEKYLGLGPGAHSFNGTERQFNISNNAKYIKAILSDNLPAEIDPLTKEDVINEYILTSLRTSEGCDLEKLKVENGHDLFLRCEMYINDLIKKNLCFILGNRLILTTKGKLLADKISADLFI